MVKYFMDFEFDTGGVALAPRPETEILVERALGFIPPDKPRNILDVGTGTGNIAISLTKYRPLSRIVALDVSAAALSAARRNAAKCASSGRIKFVQSDLFEGLRPGCFINYFDIIISNPPYISYSDFSSLPPEVRDEPYIALYGGKDGLCFYRKIIAGSPAHLKKNGILFFEVGYDQAGEVKSLMQRSGAFCGIEIYKDYAGIERVVKGRYNK